jgi:hypothetical protein
MMQDMVTDPGSPDAVLRGTLVHAHHAAAQAHYLSARAHLQSGDHARLAADLLAARLHITDALKHSGLTDDDGASACDTTRSLAWRLMGGNGDGVGEHLDVLERLIASLARAEAGRSAWLRVADAGAPLV